VNLEVDLIARYVARMLETQSNTSVKTWITSFDIA
jgi:riboflavin synthase alpha subunit